MPTTAAQGSETLGRVQDAFLASLIALKPELTERLSALTLPTIKDEEWRFTNLATLKQATFAPATQAPEVTLEDIAPFILPEARASRMVFVNGLHAPHLSDVSALGHTIEFASETWEETEGDAFDALNALFATASTAIRIPRAQLAPSPIHLLFVTVPQETPVMASPRVKVTLETMSEATLIEDYVALGDGAAFTNTATEFSVAAGARLKHVRLQRENRQTHHLGRSVATLARDAVYAAHAISLGGVFSRYEPKAVQTAEGTDVSMHGLLLLSGEQLGDTHSTLDHAMPHGTSNQIHKCIVADKARAVFNGKILVRKDAQQTNSAQSSRNLLLSPKARVDAKPQLEIFADDVKCAHGATVGQLDPEEVFYLQSRGLSESDARSLLVYAFAAEVFEHVPIPSIKEQLRTLVQEQLLASQSE
ncbi:Fe-S cluster assembly protein SufD [bacterium]|nr:Fe-S cluster assembly protein SufD [bacterium]